MATEAPTGVARELMRRLSVPPHNGAEKDLQRLFLAENGEAIWDEILSIIQSVLSPHQRGDDTITQEVFLHLMALQNFAEFSIENFSDTEIRQSVIALLREDLQKQ